MDALNVLPPPVDPPADAWANALANALADPRPAEELLDLIPAESDDDLGQTDVAAAAAEPDEHDPSGHDVAEYGAVADPDGSAAEHPTGVDDDSSAHDHPWPDSETDPPASGADGPWGDAEGQLGHW